MPEYAITMSWDKEASVWYAVNDEIPIALESSSFDVLVERVKVAAIEMLQLNGKDQHCILNFSAKREESVA